MAAKTLTEMYTVNHYNWAFLLKSLYHGMLASLVKIQLTSITGFLPSNKLPETHFKPINAKCMHLHIKKHWLVMKYMATCTMTSTLPSFLVCQRGLGSCLSTSLTFVPRI